MVRVVCHQQSRQEHTKRHAQQAAGEVHHLLGQNGLTAFATALWLRWLLLLEQSFLQLSLCQGELRLSNPSILFGDECSESGRFGTRD